MLPRFAYTPSVPAVALLMLMSGCASLPADQGRGAVTASLQSRGLTALPVADLRGFTQQALAEPLSLDTAIQLALLHSPELRAQAAKLGLAAADVYEAGRLSNPLLSITRLDGSRAEQPQLNLGIAFNFTELLFLRSRSRIADAELAATQAELGTQTLALAAAVEADYQRVLAAARIAALRTQLADGAEAGAELAQRFFDAGNLKRADLALQQAAAAEARLEADGADTELQQARAALLRTIGIGIDVAGTQWRLSGSLQAVQETVPDFEALLPLARESRLDLVAARRHADAVAARYGLTRRSAWLGEIEVGAERERETDGSILAGPTLGIALPLFDWGRGHKARAAAELQAAEAALAARELDVMHELRAALRELEATRARAERYRQMLIPARETVVEQLQREQNYMLIDVFELLAARQDSGRAYLGYLDALRDHALARAELARALGRRVPDAAHHGTTMPATPAPTPAHEHHHEATP